MAQSETLLTLGTIFIEGVCLNRSLAASRLYSAFICGFQKELHTCFKFQKKPSAAQILGTKSLLVLTGSLL